MAMVPVDEKTLRAAMHDPRFWTSWHPEQKDFRNWLEESRGVMIRNGDRNGGVVHVKAYERRGKDGAVEHVRAHERGAPEGGGGTGTAQTLPHVEGGEKGEAVPLVHWIDGRARPRVDLLQDVQAPAARAANPEAGAPSDAERAAANLHNPQGMSDVERDTLYNSEIRRGTSEQVHFPGGNASGGHPGRRLRHGRPKLGGDPGRPRGHRG